MTEVIKKIAKKYKFGYLTDEDLEQQGYVECMEALERYDGRAPLANFLAVNLHNRLFNFRRDEYYRYNPKCSDECRCRFCKQKQDKKNLLNPLDIFEYSNNFTLNEDEPKEIADILQKIDRDLPVEFREDYLKLKNGSKLTKTRKINVIAKLKEIVYGG